MSRTWLSSGLLLGMAALAMSVGSGIDVTQRRIEQLAFPYAWSLVGWESQNIPAGFRLIFAQTGDHHDDERGQGVADYLAREGALAGDPGAPLLLASAVSRGLRSVGGPTLGANVFPPVMLAVGEAPRLLVVSPRERILLSHWLILEGRMHPGAIEELETQVERLGLSAIVIEAIALGTYPVLIPADTPARFALQTVAHEWTHVALFPSLLGLAYGSSPEARAINETTADLVAEEVAAAVLSAVQTSPSPSEPRQNVIQSRLRSIRLEVDGLLAEGRVVEAERHMEEARRGLVAEGYRIRRLNQAYFAFHGNYAEGPSASTEVPDALRALRARTASLAEFLARVGQLSSVEELRRAVPP